MKAKKVDEFPAEMEMRLAACSPQERATALIYAVEYCLRLRRRADGPGSVISGWLLEPGNLSADSCESLYTHLEGIYSKICAKIRTTNATEHEIKAIADRHGEQHAEYFRASVEEPARLGAMGIGVLMTRLSYRYGRLATATNDVSDDPQSAYTRIAELLKDCVPHIGDATRRHQRVTAILTPAHPLSDEGTIFVEKSAEMIASTYPG